MAYELKTKKNKGSVKKYLAGILDLQKRKDTEVLIKLLTKLSKAKPTMWGDSMVGFSIYHYRGRTSEGDWPRTAVSARKANLTLYIMNGFSDYKALLKKLGPVKTGGSCLYIKRLSDIHLPTLTMIIKKSLATMDKKYPRS